MEPGRTGYGKSDEAFWQGREKHLGECIGQPCCTLAGMCSMLAVMEGDFAVVIHGERDCINSSFAFQGVSGGNVYCTGLTQRDAVMGRGGEVLEDCLEAVLERSPKAVFVLGTCLTEMTGEDYERVALAAEKRHGIPVTALRTSGLKSGSQSEMLDWLWASLLPSGKPAAGRRNPPGGAANAKTTKSINLFGFPTREDRGEPFVKERLRVFEGIGVGINGSYPGAANFSEWRRIFQADATFVLDTSVYPRLVSGLESGGMPVCEVPFPVGLGPTLKFYETIADRFGRSAQLKRVLKNEAPGAGDAIKGFKRRHAGKRLAYAIRMTTNYLSELVAYDGLGNLPFFLELGFDPVIMVQGPTEKKAKDSFTRRIRQLGFGQPVDVFPDPFLLRPILREGRFDLAYLAGHARKEAADAGVPMVPYGTLRPFLSSIPHNVLFVESLLSGGGA